MNCPACGFANPGGVRFCGSCASPLKLVCPACAFENPPGFRFCGQCAKSLAAAGGEPLPSACDPRSYTAAAGFEQMTALCRDQRHQALAASAASDHGWWAALFGELPTALTHARRGLEIAEKIGSQMARVYAYNAVGYAELRSERWEEAAAALEQGLRIATEMRTGEEAGLLTVAHLAETRLGQGDFARAQELAEKAVGEACRLHLLASECFARLVEARVLLAAAGTARRAGAAIERALTLVEATGARCYEPFLVAEREKLARLSAVGPSPHS